MLPSWFLTKPELSRRLWIIAGYVGSLMIIVLSLVPPKFRPHTDVGGQYEHAIAYALVSTAFGMGYRTIRGSLFAGLALTAGAAAIEVLQNFVPGRSPEAIGFLASSLGAWLGLGLSIVVLGFYKWHREVCTGRLQKVWRSINRCAGHSAGTPAAGNYPVREMLRRKAMNYLLRIF